MNFKYKALLQKFFSEVPYGEKINYFFQKYITRSLPIPDNEFLEKLRTVNVHFQNFCRFSGKDPSECSYYEFGSGYDMVIPLGFSLKGFKSLTSIDIRELVFPGLINDSTTRFKKFQNESELEYNFHEEVPKINKKNYRNVLKTKFRINYKAPFDARATGIESSSIDFIVSNATLEHIPKDGIVKILQECYRILKPGGIMSNIIDYRDHWSFFDNSISVYNFLKYSESEWKKYNPPIMYQNRMRHREYIELINNVNFEIEYEQKFHGLENDLEKLKDITIDSYFVDSFTEEEIKVTGSLLVLKK